jgi:hypothetical protein
MLFFHRPRSLQPTLCVDNVAQGGEPATETNALDAALGASANGFVYLDKSDDPGTPVGFGGGAFALAVRNRLMLPLTLDSGRQPASDIAR